MEDISEEGKGTNSKKLNDEGGDVDNKENEDKKSEEGENEVSVLNLHVNNNYNKKIQRIFSYSWKRNTCSEKLGFYFIKKKNNDACRQAR